MAERLDGFLADAGWAEALRTPLAGDASARRYWRLSRNGKTAILMDAPPSEAPSCRAFLHVAGWLVANGLSAPRIMAADADHGLILMEDLGDGLFARICNTHPEQETTLYRAAVDVLALLHRLPPPEGLAPYDTAACQAESRLVTDWYLPAATGRPFPDRDSDAGAELDALIAAPLAALDPAPPVCVLRDYHAENLLWLPARRGLGRVGLLDFQDALAGHPAYDLVSLLEDARRDTAPALQQAMLAAYLAETGQDAGPFRQACATLGAQRNLKILGIFARLWLRDGKPGYLDLLPRVWGHLMQDLGHPALAELRRFVERRLPPPDTETRHRIRAARP